MNRMGYACINMNLSECKPRVTTNRTMIKRTFKDKGLPYASELALQNCKDLLTILKWNNDNGFNFFRLSSDLMPWASEYDITTLPHFKILCFFKSFFISSSITGSSIVAGIL